MTIFFGDVMADLSTPKYDACREFIDHYRNSGSDWDNIKMLWSNSEKELQDELDREKKRNPRWPSSLSVEEWFDIVEQKKQAEESAQGIKKREESKAPIILNKNKGENNEVFTEPADKRSSWQLYKKQLKKDGFSEVAINNITKSTLSVLQKLNKGTEDSPTEITKGLVIGNVQSGKTANINALITMAADWGWNFFVILSGTLDILRRQTRKRLSEGGFQSGNLHWNTFEKLKPNTTEHDQTFQNLFKNKDERYIYVCIKYSSRLNDLITWFGDDKNTQKKVKMLIIDDEADQASINTRDIRNEEPSKINDLIKKLANGTDKNFQSINYIGYTATPYANILNESGENSLYPKDFIAVLPVSNEYFGPQQIFGCYTQTCNFNGLNIIRKIADNDIEQIENIHKGESFTLPESMITAIIWFLCCVSCVRYLNIIKKPISMLIHTSMKTDYHDRITKSIFNWFDNTDRQKILCEAEELWNSEKESFSPREFKESYNNYTNDIDELPSFSEIKTELEKLLEIRPSRIKFDQNAGYKYTKGVHICTDNSENNYVDENGDYSRIFYPDKKLEYASAFIVIGGNTLSRGLTLEGLTSTYFLRTVTQADTLMQMGRWFGYRGNYELLPRIWITDRAQSQFKFLALLDQELREEIEYMVNTARSPSEYGPKVNNNPDKSCLIKITSKNKMQSAKAAEVDYSGITKQTYLFDNDINKLKNNIKLTEDFLGKLGESFNQKNGISSNNNSVLWNEVDFNFVEDYLHKFYFQKRLSLFGNIDSLLKWLSECVEKDNSFKKWNILVASIKSDNNGTWELPNKEVVNKVSRTRKKNNRADDSIIDIGVLWNKTDIVRDYELINGISITNRNSIEAIVERDKNISNPVIVIYRIDKNSKEDANSTIRCKLDTPEDLIGLCIHIPGTGRHNHVTSICIDLPLESDINDGD